MNRYTFFALLLLLVAGALPLSALDGKVVTVSGKVEIQDSAGVWKTLKAGDTVISGSMISTGFKSEATLKLGASILTIKPLTRMTLTQLVEKEEIVDTELFLEVGNVKAEVNSLNNKKNGFTVKSPVATASVRGTVFEMGDDLVVMQGNVLYASTIGQTRSATAGQKLEMIKGSVSSPATALETRMVTIILSNVPSTEVRSPILVTTSAPPQPMPPASAADPVPVQSTQTILALELN